MKHHLDLVVDGVEHDVRQLRLAEGVGAALVGALVVAAVVVDIRFTLCLMGLADHGPLKAEYTDFRENYRELIEEKQEALKRLKREQQDAAAMGSQNRAWVQVFAQYENVQELDRRLLLALVDKTR